MVVLLFLALLQVPAPVVNRQWCEDDGNKWSEDTHTCYILEQLAAPGAALERLAPPPTHLQKPKEKERWWIRSLKNVRAGLKRVFQDDGTSRP